MLFASRRIRMAACLAVATSVCLPISECRSKPTGPTKPVKSAEKPVNDVEEIGWMRLDPGPRPSASMMAAKPADLPTYYRSLYLVKPDRRLLYAFAEIDRILGSRHMPATLTVRFENGGWRLALDKQEIGTLSEIPTFSEVRRLLSDWTGKCLARFGTRPDAAPISDLAPLEQDLTQGSTSRVIAALRALNGLAAQHPFHPQLLAAAARGTIWLTLQTRDELELSDPLAGHALALLVLAQSLDPGSLAADQVLLYRELGYEAAATEASQLLPADDPIRLWANFDARGLVKASSSIGATPRTQYLELLELAHRGGRETWFAAFRKSTWAREVNASTIRLILDLNDFASDHTAPEALTTSAFLAVSKPEGGGSSTPSSEHWGPGSWPDVPLGGYLQNAASETSSPLQGQTGVFENLVNKRALASDGGLFDRESARAFYRATFYTGIHRSARFLFDQFGSTDDAERYANSMKDPAPGTAAELRRWMLLRVQALRGQMKPAEAIGTVEELRHLGIVPVRRIIQSLLRSLSSGVDLVRRDAIKVEFRRLDTRPGSLALGWNASYELSDLRLGEKCLRAAIDSAPVGEGTAPVDFAYWTRSAAHLKRIAGDRRFTASVRGAALDRLADMEDKDIAFRRVRFLELLDEQPEDTTVLDRYVGLLTASKDTRGAAEAIRRWLANRRTQDEDLPWAHALTLHADLLASEKNWDEAWRIIKPAVPTGKGEVLLDAAWFLEEQREWDEAFAMAQSTHARYSGDSTSLAIMARILWRQGKYAEAADLLRKSSILRRSDWEGNLAGSFARVFEKEDPHRTRNAFDALRKVGITPYLLAPLAQEIGKRGDHKLAFALLESISAGPIEEFDELEKAEGHDKAVAWLRQNVRVTHQLALEAFRRQRYELLWEPLEDPARASKNDEIQLMRAASLIPSSNADSSRRDGLIRYFEARPRKGWAPMALFLLGQAKPEELYGAVSDLSRVCNLGWLMGLRAADEGRYEEASDWFGIAVETGQEKTPPDTWAIEILHRWEAKRRFLADLARERVL